MKSKATNNPLWVIFFTIFLDALGFGILIPIIPLLLADPQSSFYLLPASMSISSGYLLLGLLTASYPFGQFIATPIFGQLSDKFGRKYILALALTGTALSYVFFALGILFKNLPLLFVARFFDGITGGNISVAQAAIADVTTPANRAKNFGLIGAAFGMGFVVGPYLGGKLSDPHLVSWFNATTPFWFAGILSMLNVLSVIFFLPETHKNRAKNLTINWTKSLANILHAYTLKPVRLLFTMTFLFQGGFTFFTTFFSVYLIERFSFTQGNIGDYFAFVGLWMAFTQAFLTRKVGSKFAEYQILRLSFLVADIAILGYSFAQNWIQLILIVPPFAMAFGLSMANLTALISRSVDGKVQGEILGINASVQALAQTIPPLLSGYIAAKFAADAPIWIAAIIMMMASFIFIGLYRVQK